MTPEQLAALKEVASNARDGYSSYEREFGREFTPTTCLALLEEVERLQKAFDELYGYWQDAVTEPTIKQRVGKGLIDAFRGDPRYQKRSKK